MAFTIITVTGGPFLRADGEFAEGSLSATLSEQIQNGVTIVDPSPVSGVFTAGLLKDDTGELPFTVVANNDPGTTPAGSTYVLVLTLDSAPVVTARVLIAYSAAGATVDLSALL